MRRNRSIKIFRKLHKWPGIIIAFFAILFAGSGILTNHRQTFSYVDISRKLLPPNYSYKNWNLAAVRGSFPLDSANYLIYGNIGIWKTQKYPESFTDFNLGFPKGIDNRKISSVIQLGNTLFAGTHFGLYKRELSAEEWQIVNIPQNKQRITDLALKNDTLLVLTRHHLLKSADGETFNTVQLPQPEGYERKAGLFKTLYDLHSGELLGLAGKLTVDLLGVVTIVLSVTGLLHFFFPKIIKRRKKKRLKAKVLINSLKTNLRWHNVLGYIFVSFLIINTLAGIHLRPPLLIPIAEKKVGIIPGTNLDNPNPWFDKLRSVVWDENINQYIFSTSEGFYFAEESLSGQLTPVIPQPAVSVMGLNVFRPLGEMKYLTGSFNGMFLWNLQTGQISDFFTGAPYKPTQGTGKPIADNMIAGLVETGDYAWWFDYHRGALPLTGVPFPDMPEEIHKKSPVSLWNASLEIHTGRIFEHIVGQFYILYVPLAGICLIMVLASGFFIWWKAYRKKRRKSKPA